MRVDALLDEAEGALKNLVVALDRVASQNPDDGTGLAAHVIFYDGVKLRQWPWPDIAEQVYADEGMDPGMWIWEGTPQLVHSRNLKLDNGRWRKLKGWEESRIEKGESPWEEQNDDD